MPQFMGLRRVEHDEETEQQIWFSIFFISDVCVVGSNDNFRFDLGLTVFTYVEWYRSLSDKNRHLSYF